MAGKQSVAFEAFSRLARACATVAEVVATLCLTGVLIDVLTGVVFRYVLGQPLIWTEELARFLIITVTFIGAVVPLERGTHFEVRFVVDRLPTAWQTIALTVMNLVVGACLVALLVFGVQMTAVSMQESSPALNIPYGITYAMIPIGAALMLPVVLRNLWRLALGIGNVEA